MWLRERSGCTSLIQNLGPETQPVAYLSQTGQNGSRVAWVPIGHHCYYLFTKETTKITLCQPMFVLIPHQVNTVLQLKGHIWMTGTLGYPVGKPWGDYGHL
jgi:hypothetical protein